MGTRAINSIIGSMICQGLLMRDLEERETKEGVGVYLSLSACRCTDDKLCVISHLLCTYGPIAVFMTALPIFYCSTWRKSELRKEQAEAGWGTLGTKHTPSHPHSEEECGGDPGG